MSMSLRILVPPHPLIKHWLSILRNETTPPALFATGIEQIGRWLTYEALRDWIPYKKQTIQTSQGKVEGDIIDPQYKIYVLPINSGGINLWIGSRDLIPNVNTYIYKIPEEIDNKTGAILYLGQITTGKTVIKYVSKLKKMNVEVNRIRIISVIASSSGLTEIAKHHPDLIIYTSCIDEKINESGEIIPGIGNLDFRLTTI